MPALLTQSTMMMCPHGGTVTAIPNSTRAQADGTPVLRASDTFVVAGCSLLSPCVTVQWVLPGLRVKHSGDFTLNQASVGLCLSGSQTPQGMVLIAATQPRVSGL